MADTNSNSSAAPLDGNPLPMANNWCTTELEVVKCDYVWNIKNYSCNTKKLGEFLTSSTFSDDSSDEQRPKWFLRLYPNGDREESKGYVAVFLFLAKPNNSAAAINLNFKLSILDAKCKKTNNLSVTHTFAQGSASLGWNKFISHEYLLDKKNALLPDDRLSIFCEISMVVDEINSIGQSGCSVPQSHLVEDFGALLESGLLADCVIWADNQEFKTEGLLAAADKYQLDRLKALCEQQLSKGLTKENVCAMLVLANLHNAEQLKKRALEYANLHKDEVRATEGWHALSEPELLKQLFLGSRKRGDGPGPGANGSPKRPNQ